MPEPVAVPVRRAVPLPLAPLQLGAQHLVVVAPRRLDQAHRARRARDAHRVLHRERVAALPVESDVGRAVVGVALDTMQQMQQHLLLRKYDGFMKKGGRIRFRGRNVQQGF